ncbi:hypothetical protein M8J77_006786 [Diaphorina citri]|nr:hypothetical protein M8J77_006786 [Diaphorina citri]
MYSMYNLREGKSTLEDTTHNACAQTREKLSGFPEHFRHATLRILLQWGYTDEDRCDCGSIQTEAHLLTCPDLPETYTMEDLQVANDKAVAVTRYWMNKI